MQRGTKYNRSEANSSPIAEPSVGAVSFKRNKTMKHTQERISNVIKKIKFTFNYGDEVFVGYSDGTRWNGWDNISVTEDVHNEIENYFDNDADCEMEIKKGENGLYSYGYGFTTSIIKEG